MKLIDKDKVVAKIENIIADETESIKSFEHSKNVSEVQRSNARIGVLTHLRSFVGTLEVKEVDLEKELDKYTTNNFWALDGNSESPYLVEKDDMLKIAKHFYELGLKAQKGE